MSQYGCSMNCQWLFTFWLIHQNYYKTTITTWLRPRLKARQRLCQASLTIVTYNHHNMFIVQATGGMCNGSVYLCRYLWCHTSDFQHHASSGVHPINLSCPHYNKLVHFLLFQPSLMFLNKTASFQVLLFNAWPLALLLGQC
jgi:hypothetical protein